MFLVKLAKQAVAVSGVTILSVQAAFAQHQGGGSRFWWRWWRDRPHDGGGSSSNTYHAAPEIDASTGLLALAAVLAAVALTYELRRRRKS